MNEPAANPATRSARPKRTAPEPRAMIKAHPRRTRFSRLVRRKLFWAVASVPLIIAGICGWMTEPFENKPSGSTPYLSPKPKAPAPPRPALAAWPTAPTSDRAATVLLLDSLKDAKIRLERANTYTALLRKTERLNGRLGAEQVLEMKCRNAPFAIYFKFRKPEPGKEVVYSTGHYDDEVIAHATGFARALIPRLKLAPTSAVAMAGNRHPITDAGLLNLTKKLIGYRELDLTDPESVTTLDRVTDDAGRVRLRSVHTHPHNDGRRPFQLVEVLYDTETRIPMQIRSFDWPEPGERMSDDPKLAETYRYDDLKLGVELSDMDFDPANPDYDFKRF